jgi:hypothetical protein
MKIPEEFELLSIFESEPQFDADIKTVPFSYNQVKYNMGNSSKQVFKIELSPAYNEFKISITQEDKDIGYFEFKNIQSLTILDEKTSRFMITQKSAVTKIQLKPQFQIFHNEETIH